LLGRRERNVVEKHKAPITGVERLVSILKKGQPVGVRSARRKGRYK
jgi:hypothetical protein